MEVNRRKERRLKKNRTKKYRIVYWFGSIKTDCIVTANCTEEAKKNFIELKGDKKIIEIEEIQ